MRRGHNIHNRPTFAVCPVEGCGQTNVSPAHVLGHSNKGSKHKLTKEQRKARGDNMSTTIKRYWKDWRRNKALAVNTEKK
jgi:hypothetical protein